MTNIFNVKHENLLKLVSDLPQNNGLLKSVNIYSIRINNLIACCIVNDIFGHARTFPSKFTPILQPLMTSIKNDTCVLRSKLTTKALKDLICMIPKQQVKEKIVNNLMQFFLNRCNTGTDNAAIGYCLRFLAWHCEMNDLICLYNYLSTNEMGPLMIDQALLISDDSVKNVDDIENHSLFKHYIQELPKLIQLSIAVSESNISKYAQNVVVLFSKFNLSAVMKSLKKILTQSHTDARVVGLISELICIHPSVAIVPYVTLLLSYVFANLAQTAHLFSKLVTLAPLVPYGSQQLDTEHDKNTDALMRHLIHGESLPLASPPKGLKVKLRSYQLEGISWINFLNQVGNPGAILADEMGLGEYFRYGNIYSA